MMSGYTPKQCIPMWFNSTIYNQDEPYAGMILKHKADILYYYRQYHKAKKQYQELLAIPSLHSQIAREANDSLARCLLYCGDVIEAKRIALIQNDAHYNSGTCTLLVLSDCFNCLGSTCDEILARQECTISHRHYYKYWIDLAATYKRLSHEIIGRDDIESAMFIKISNNIRKSFVPYFKFHTNVAKQTYTNSDFLKFMTFLSSKEALELKSTDMVPLLQVSTCACLLWARQLLANSCQQSHSFAVLSINEHAGIIKNMMTDFSNDLVHCINCTTVRASDLDL